MSDDVQELDERRALQALRDEDLRRCQEHERMLELDDQLEEQFACGDPAGDFDAAIERQEWGS